MNPHDWYALGAAAWLGTMAWAAAAERACRRLTTERDAAVAASALARKGAALAAEEAAIYRDLVNAAIAREKARTGGA